MFTRRFVITHRRDEIEDAQRALLHAIAAAGYSEASGFAIRLALEEALSNAFRHGNRGDPAKSVRIDCRVQSDAVTIEIEDEGEGFDPASVPDPTQLENIEIPSGRGLTLMRGFMSEVDFPPPGNRVRMTYRRP